MAVKPELVTGLALRSARKVAMLDLPPLGHLQALILKTLEDLGSDASGYAALETLSLQTGVWIDHAQVYGSIRKLELAKFIELDEVRKQKRRGAPLKIYKVTAAGRAALKEAVEHYQALARFLDDKSKRKATRP